ncbi:MAG: hypothetical protein FWE49_05655 [Synergistaceae bacterium]|nr:hypothetical protein [Synergistaceae bacterium]
MSSARSEIEGATGEDIFNEMFSQMMVSVIPLGSDVEGLNQRLSCLIGHVVSRHEGK